MRPHPLPPPGRTLATVALFLVSLFAVLLIGAPTASATTYVRGVITTDTTWGSLDTLYIATQDVTVRPSATLTILAGTTVLFDPGVHLFIEGSLVADGSNAKAIAFDANGSAVVFPWAGIQFNASSSGSVSWSTFDRVDRAVTVMDSSPSLSNNTIVQANVGFAFIRSASAVTNNTIRRTSNVGIYANASDVQISGNTINGTGVAIQIEQPGTPSISGNTITNVTGPFAVGILLTGGATALIDSNVIQGVTGSRGPNGVGPGAAGRDGGIAVGMYVDGAPSATVTWNLIDAVTGGRGGDGQGNAGAIGGRGGNGGPAVGIVVAGALDVFVQGNTVTGMTGGRGGAGGSGVTTATGGAGGDAGTAVGIEIALVGLTTGVSVNTVDGILGGMGGFGGDAIVDGNGGRGGDSDGVFLISVAQAQVTENFIQGLQGGLGGNSTATGVGNGNGAMAGSVMGVAIFGVRGSASIQGNGIFTLTGGDGGRGSRGGQGGNSTGILPLGIDDGLFNETLIHFNQILDVAGGAGGLGSRFGGHGGVAAGIGALYVTPTSSANAVESVAGGAGGDALDGTDGGKGGDAHGFVGALLSNGISSWESISGVTKGPAGSGPPVQASYATGYYIVGNTSLTTRFLVENASFSGVAGYEFFLENYTDAIALNTPFTNVVVRSAGNLTVRNFLDVGALWPNGLTPVTGARLRVDDNGSPVWDRVTPTGGQSWIAVTDRVYINSATATENETRVTVTYASYVFTTSPRMVNMASSHSEYFTMVDSDDPTSAATLLPTYETALTFVVGYTANDGNGQGLGNITLWYRTGESGGWIAFATQPAGATGQFLFTAPGDGRYEFATIADDLAGNIQPGPSANNTWTIVDTLAPASHVNALPQFENTTSILVTWAPDAGVTDIATYTIQVDDGSGWTNWLVATSALSGTFTAAADGVYAFRAIAKDRAGLVETAPTGNDTWTIVDLTRPLVTSSTPQGGDTSITPFVVIAFDEPMDRSSVEGAFSISSGVSGTVVWSSDSRTMTFIPDGPLQAGTSYTVLVGTQATDRAGNHMLQPLTFQFSTVAPAPAGLALSDFWWLFLIVGALVGGALFMILRRRTAMEATPATPAPAAKVSEAIIEDVFLLNHRDGILIKHETRRLRPDVDTDILTGMLTAVQQFVKDALRGDDYADLNEMTVGHMHILIGRGKWLVLAARIEGDGTQSWTGQIERCIKDMEDHQWDQLEDWDGDMAIARVLMPYLKRLIQGGYALVDA